MRSGCLGVVISIGIVAFAAVLASVSLALIGSFAISALRQPSGTSTVLGLVIASVAGLCFFLIGRNIWRELRDGRKKPGKRQN